MCNHCLLVLTRRNIIPGFVTWCRISLAFRCSSFWKILGLDVRVSQTTMSWPSGRWAWKWRWHDADTCGSSPTTRSALFICCCFRGCMLDAWLTNSSMWCCCLLKDESSKESHCWVHGSQIAQTEGCLGSFDFRNASEKPRVAFPKGLPCKFLAPSCVISRESL